MFGDIGKIMKTAARMNAGMPELQARLESSHYTARAGGAVTATVNGKLAVVEIVIDPTAAADLAGDVQMLADLVKAAVATAQKQAAEAAGQAMKELTGGMDMPGLDDIMP